MKVEGCIYPFIKNLVPVLKWANLWIGEFFVFFLLAWLHINVDKFDNEKIKWEVHESNCQWCISE